MSEGKTNNESVKEHTEVEFAEEQEKELKKLLDDEEEKKQEPTDEEVDLELNELYAKIEAGIKPETIKLIKENFSSLASEDDATIKEAMFRVIRDINEIEFSLKIGSMGLEENKEKELKRLFSSIKRSMSLNICEYDMNEFIPMAINKGILKEEEGTLESINIVKLSKDTKKEENEKKEEKKEEKVKLGTSVGTNRRANGISYKETFPLLKNTDIDEVKKILVEIVKEREGIKSDLPTQKKHNFKFLSEKQAIRAFKSLSKTVRTVENEKEYERNINTLAAALKNSGIGENDIEEARKRISEKDRGRAIRTEERDNEKETIKKRREVLRKRYIETDEKFQEKYSEKKALASNKHSVSKSTTQPAPSKPSAQPKQVPSAQPQQLAQTQVPQPVEPEQKQGFGSTLKKEFEAFKNDVGEKARAFKNNIKELFAPNHEVQTEQQQVEVLQVDQKGGLQINATAGATNQEHLETVVFDIQPRIATSVNHKIETAFLIDQPNVVTDVTNLEQKQDKKQDEAPVTTGPTLVSSVNSNTDPNVSPKKDPNQSSIEKEVDSEIEAINKMINRLNKQWVGKASIENFDKKKKEYPDLMAELVRRVANLEAKVVSDKTLSDRIVTSCTSFRRNINDIKNAFEKYEDIEFGKNSILEGLAGALTAGSKTEIDDEATLLKNSHRNSKEIKQMQGESQLMYGKGFELDTKNGAKVKNFLNNIKEDIVNFGKFVDSLKEENTKKLIKGLRELNTIDDIKKFNANNAKNSEIYTDLPRIEEFQYKKGKTLSMDKSNSIKGKFVYGNGNEEKCDIEFKINSNLGNFYANHATYGCNMLMNIMSEHNFDISKCDLVINGNKIDNFKKLKELSENKPGIFEKLANGCQDYEDFKKKLDERKGIIQQNALGLGSKRNGQVR